jgi:hypothetical protein
MPLVTPALIGTPGAAVASAGNVVTPTTLTPPTGTGYAVGDTLLCFTACSSATPTVATPAGWTSILNVTGTNGRIALFAKVAASTSEAAPSVVWSGLTTGTSGTPCQAIVAAFTNLEDSVLASMADVVGASANGAASTATSAGGAAITTTLDKSLVLSLTTRLDDAFTTFTAPAGFTNVTAAQGTTSGADFAMGWAYQVKTPAGAVTAPNFGLTGASSFASTGVMVALKAGSSIDYTDTCTGAFPLTGSVVESYAPPYSGLILGTPGLIDYWRLNETAGNMLDSKGANPGTTVGASMTRGVTGLLSNDADKAISGAGSGTTSYVNIPASASMDVTNKLTLELWIKPSAIPAGFSPVIINRGGDKPWYIRHYGAGDGRIEFNVYDSAGTRISTAAGVAQVGVIQHIAMTYDSAAGANALKCYVNGALLSTAAATANPNLFTGGAVVIGDRSVGSGTSFAGVIDEVALYNVALTQAQLLSHYNTGIALATAKSNNADGGTDGTAVTIANSGGASGDAFDSVTPLTGAPDQPIFSSDQVAHGNLAYKIGPTFISNCYVEHQIQAASRLYGRMYLRATSVTPSNGPCAILRFYNGSTLACGLSITNIPGGKLQWQAGPIGNAQVGSPSTNTLPIDTWVRIEWDVAFSATAAVLTARYFASMDATIPTETITVSAQNTNSQVQADRVRYGLVLNNFGTGPTIWLDSLNVNAVAFPGPDLTLSDSPSATFPLSGTRAESRSAADTCTGIFVLSGSRTESYSGPTRYTDACTGIFALSGSVIENFNGRGDAWVVSRIHERPPLRHSIALTTPTNRHYRWGEDEPLPENVFNGLRWGSTMPGGYDSCDCVLPRKAGATYNDLERLSTLQIVGAGGSVVGEYRLERTPQTSGDQMAITPSAVGWQAHLDDNKGVSIIFIDRELGDWGGPSRQRILTLLTAGYNPVGGGTVVPDTTTGVPALDVGFDDPGGWVSTNKPIVEAMYDAGPGNTIGRVRGTWTIYGATGATDVNWTLYFSLTSTDTLSSSDVVGDIMNGLQGATGNVDLVATANRRFAAIQWYYAIAGGAAGNNNRYGLNVSLMRLFGPHNLTVRGSTPQTEGLFASDMIAYSVGKWAPMLRVTADSIQATSFIIPQAKFKDTTTVSEIVKQSTRFGLEDWAVWNDKIFYLSPRNANPLAKKWRARIGPAKLEQTGPQMDRLWESILVQYTDVDGTTRVVGPPGSGVDVEDARLKDSDPANPSNALGITRRDKLVMGTSTSAGAIEVGRRFLEEQKLVDRSGRASLVGHVEDDRGIMHAYSDIRAGDAISFIDAADQSYRRIVKVSHDYSSKTASVDLDAPPEGLQAVLERLGVVLAPLGL